MLHSTVLDCDPQYLDISLTEWLARCMIYSKREKVFQKTTNHVKSKAAREYFSATNLGACQQQCCQWNYWLPKGVFECALLLKRTVVSLSSRCWGDYQPKILPSWAAKWPKCPSSRRCTYIVCLTVLDQGYPYAPTIYVCVFNWLRITFLILVLLSEQPQWEVVFVTKTDWLYPIFNCSDNSSFSSL